MSLNRLPTLDYDPGTTGIYLTIKSDAGYWDGDADFVSDLADAAHVPVPEDPDVAGIYRVDAGSLTGLPAGDYEYVGFRPPNAGETGDQYIGRDPEWHWDGTRGTPGTVTPPPDLSLSAGYLLDETPGTSFTFRRTGAAGAAGYGWSEAPWTVAADGTGLVQSAAFVRGHTYEASRDGGEVHSFVVPDAGTFALPEMLSERP